MYLRERIEPASHAIFVLQYNKLLKPRTKELAAKPGVFEPLALDLQKLGDAIFQPGFLRRSRNHPRELDLEQVEPFAKTVFGYSPIERKLTVYKRRLLPLLDMEDRFFEEALNPDKQSINSLNFGILIFNLYTVYKHLDLAITNNSQTLEHQLTLADWRHYYAKRVGLRSFGKDERGRPRLLHHMSYIEDLNMSDENQAFMEHFSPPHTPAPGGGPPSPWEGGAVGPAMNWDYDYDKQDDNDDFANMDWTGLDEPEEYDLAPQRRTSANSMQVPSGRSASRDMF
jgi:hypothetical protein